MKVFVYGTLKPGERNYRYYCAGKVSQTTQAYTYGKLFNLPGCGYPAMTVGQNQVKGVLLTFIDDSVLAHLDELEDYNPQRLATENEYSRQKILVYSLLGEPLGEAWSYLMMPHKVKCLGGVLVPSGWWTHST